MKDSQLTHIIAGVVIRQDNKFLLVQENNPKCYGQWNWPAGRVDEGVSIEQAAITEAQEEVGLTVGLIKKIDIFSQANNPYVPMHLFLARVISGTVIPDSKELLDAKFFTIEEIKNLELRDPWVLHGAEMIASQN